MLEFEILQELQPSAEILEIIKDYEYKVNEIASKNFYIKEYNQKYNLKQIKQIIMKLKIQIAKLHFSQETYLEYDKKEMYKYFDNLLKEINIEYRTTTISFANYLYIIFASAKILEMDSAQQNKVALYLFNSINFKAKNGKNLDNRKQMF